MFSIFSNPKLIAFIIAICLILLLARLKFQSINFSRFGYSLETCRIVDHEPIEDIEAEDAYIPENVNFRNSKIELTKQLKPKDQLKAPWTIFSTKATTTTLPNYENQDNPWIILGFSNFAYSKIAKLWYFQLSKLGYKEHRVVPLDSKSRDFDSRSSYI